MFVSGYSKGLKVCCVNTHCQEKWRAVILKLCNASDLPSDGTMKSFRSGAFDICVAQCGEATYAFNNRCPHQNAPLSTGVLNGCAVTCPYHAWQFDISTGLAEVEGDPSLTRYAVRQIQDEVFVQLPG